MDVSEDHVATMLRIQEQAKRETSKNQIASGARSDATE
jgi:hypothetical protein